MVLVKGLKIPWTERVTNEEVYIRIKKKRSIWTVVDSSGEKKEVDRTFHNKQYIDNDYN